MLISLFLFLYEIMTLSVDLTVAAATSATTFTRYKEMFKVSRKCKLQ